MKTDGYNNLLSIELGQLHTEAPAPSRTISIMKKTPSSVPRTFACHYQQN